jgi:hypothetical protein
METKRSTHTRFKAIVLFIGALGCALAVYGAILGSRSLPQESDSNDEVYETRIGEEGHIQLRPRLTVSSHEIRIPAEKAREVMREGKKAAGTFIVSNVGDADLLLRLHYAQCSCSVPDFGDERLLSAGEEAPLTIEARVPPAGEISAEVDISYGGNESKTRLRLIVESGQEVPYLHRVSPRQLIFRPVNDSPITLNVHIQTFEASDDTWIHHAHCDVRGLVVGAPAVETMRAGDGIVLREYRFPVTLNEPGSESQGSIQLCADGSDAPVVTIDCRVEPTSPIRVVPRPLIVNVTPDQGPIRKKVLLVLQEKIGKEFKVDLAKSVFPDWVTVVVTDDKPTLQTIGVTFTDPPPDVEKCELILATNHSRHSELRLPVHFVRSTFVRSGSAR